MDKRMTDLIEALEVVAKEAAREATNIGDSARPGDQGRANTFRFIRDYARGAIAKVEKQTLMAKESGNV